jgi:hypothetical protein
MLFDHRTYTCRPGTIRKQVALYEEFGLAPQTKHLGQPVFYGLTESGNVNSFVHIWAYENAADREKRRAAMQADPDWQTYLSKSGEAGYLISQENKLMTAAPFFKLKR